MKYLIVATIVAFLVLTAPALADVVLELKSSSAPASTQPASSDSIISVLAVPGHKFMTKFTSAGRTVEASGSVQSLPDGQLRVQIKFENRSEGIQSLSTTIDLKPDEPFLLSGMQSVGGVRSTKLTVKTLDK